MNEVWDSILKSSDDNAIAMILNDHSLSEESIHQLFLIMRGWMQKLHNDKEEENCWKCVMILLKKYRSWEDVEFLCRGILLRCKMMHIRGLLVGVLHMMVGQHKEKIEIKCESLLSDFLVEGSEEIGLESLMILINSLTVLFPIFPRICSDVFVSSEFQRLIKRDLSLNDHNLIKDILHMLSTACIDDTVRTFIAENYASALEGVADIADYDIYAALVLTKIWSFTKLKPNTFAKYIGLFIKGVNERRNVEIAIEALAYLTLKSSVRVTVRNDKDFCLNIVEIIKSPHTSASQLYGALVIVANLCAIKKKQDDPANRFKNSLAPNVMNEEQIEETEKEILEFNCDYVLDLDLIGILKSKNLSEASFIETIKIIHHVARDKKSVVSCVKQGAGVMLLNYLVKRTEFAKDDLYLMALRTLSLILIYVDPKTAFNKISPLSATPLLMELLPNTETQELSGLTLTVLDSYQALMALTNLATINNGADLSRLLTSNQKYWETIENLLLDSTQEIQRSVLELLSNLMANPMNIAVKFFNFQNPRSVRNFDLLVKLLNLDDLRSQRAVAAIFANITCSVPFIAQELAEKKNLIETAIKVFISQNRDSSLRERLLVLFCSLSEVDISPLMTNDQYLIALKSCHLSSKPGDLTYELTKELLQKFNK